MFALMILIFLWLIMIVSLAIQKSIKDITNLMTIEFVDKYKYIKSKSSAVHLDSCIFFFIVDVMEGGGKQIFVKSFLQKDSD